MPQTVKLVFMMRFFDKQAGKERIVIQPGEMYVTDEDEIISTVLGSCISVCLINKAQGIAGMNHFLLPTRASGGIFSVGAEIGRFGDEALELLLGQMQKRSSDITGIVAKVFGGAAMISKCGDKKCLSQENIKAAHNFLSAHNIPIAAADTGGPAGRKIHFHSRSGTVRVETHKQKGFETLHGGTY